MRFYLLCGLLALVTLTLHAVPPTYLSLDGQPVDPPHSYYNEMWQSDVVAPGEKPCLALFPTTKKPSRGTVIIAPGGGYENLSTSKEGSNVAAPLNEAGWDAVVLIYTVGKKEDKDNVRRMALEETQKALILVQKRGSEFGLSNATIGAMGFSAGGHLMLRLAHETAQSAPPDFLVVLYPGGLMKDGKLVPEVMPPTVPIFLYVGDKDKLLPESKALDQACRDGGIRCDFTIAPGVEHGFGITKTLPEGARDWPEKLVAFLGTVTKAKP